MRVCPPGLVILAARYSGSRDKTLHSLDELLSQSASTCVAMWIGAEDRAAIVYGVEFMRAFASGRSVAVAQVAMEWPGMAGAAFLTPGQMNGKIEKKLEGIEGALCQQAERLTRIERALGIEVGV